MNKKKIIIIIIDIIVILGMIVSCNYTAKEKSDVKNGNSSEKSNNEKISGYNFKKFKYPYSSNVAFSYIDDEKFNLKGSTWSANVEIFIDINDSIFKYHDEYYKILKNFDMDVSESKKISINGNLVLIYEYRESNDKNALLCYLSTVDQFEYEITLYNNDNSFSIDNLNTIVEYLLQDEYKDDMTEIKYTYKKYDLEEYLHSSD